MVAEYRQLKASQPDDYDYGENQLNVLGYQLMAREMVDEAVAVFELNVEMFPEASNPIDSLGEAYLVAGRRELWRLLALLAIAVLLGEWFAWNRRRAA